MKPALISRRVVIDYVNRMANLVLTTHISERGSFTKDALLHRSLFYRLNDYFVSKLIWIICLYPTIYNFIVFVVYKYIF